MTRIIIGLISGVEIVGVWDKSSLEESHNFIDRKLIPNIKKAEYVTIQTEKGKVFLIGSNIVYVRTEEK